MVRIRELREAKGMQQKELAIDLCVSQPTISDWESGRKVPSARSTQKLAAYFNVSIDYLLGKEEESERAIAFLPERLEEAMNGMSCEELAQKFDGSAKVISLYLEGKRKPSKVTLHLMALYLGVNPEWLYGLDAPKYKNPTLADVDDLLSALIHNFEQLNQEGRERLVETSDDMVSSRKYIKSDKNQLGKEEA